MTITAAAFTSGIVVGAPSAPTASKTWLLNRLYVINVVGYEPGGAAAAPTSVTGSTQIITQNISSALSHTALRFMGDGSTGTKTFDFNGVSQNRIQWTIDEYDGIDLSGTNGSGAIVQAVPGTGLSTTLAATLAAFGDAVNNAVAVFGSNASGDPITKEAGYTDLSSEASFFFLRDAFKIGEDTSPTMTEPSAVLWGLFALEIKAATVVVDDPPSKQPAAQPQHQVLMAA